MAESPSKTAIKPGNIVRARAKGNNGARQYRVSVASGSTLQGFERWYTDKGNVLMESKTERTLLADTAELLAESGPKVGTVDARHGRPAKAEKAAE